MILENMKQTSNLQVGTKEKKGGGGKVTTSSRHLRRLNPALFSDQSQALFVLGGRIPNTGLESNKRMVVVWIHGLQSNIVIDK